MLTLIRDVLSFSQLSKVKQVFEKVDLNVILESVKNDFELLIEQKDCRIQSNSLPLVEAIPVQMSQLFSNLISNSLKFIPADRKPVIAITAELMSEDEIRGNRKLNSNLSYYVISFSDNGIGFHHENAVQIFDIFQRLHNRTEYEGTGIGLAMCKKIAENHHGDIYARSKPGEGATFYVALPHRQHQH
jgi:signal transduction histidine kinase